MSEVNETKKSPAVNEGDRKFTDLQSRVRTLENLCYSAKEVLNLEEAASFLGIAKSTLYKMTHLGTSIRRSWLSYGTRRKSARSSLGACIRRD